MNVKKAYREISRSPINHQYFNHSIGCPFCQTKNGPVLIELWYDEAMSNSSDSGGRRSLGQTVQANRTCIIVTMAVSGLLMMACLLMFLLAMAR